jgi:Spy/CpxP family protein refolding chaperone
MTTLAVIGAAGLVLGAGMVAAQPGPGGPGRRGPGGGEKIARVLGLSEQQQAQVRQLMDAQRPKHEALREKAEANREALREALSAGSPDPTAVGELAIEGQRLREEGRKLREAHDQALRQLLTPEQRTKFDALRSLREESGGKRRPGRGGPHGIPPGGEEERP